jgi:hypothetical protein
VWRIEPNWCRFVWHVMYMAETWVPSAISSGSSCQSSHYHFSANTYNASEHGAIHFYFFLHSSLSTCRFLGQN